MSGILDSITSALKGASSTGDNSPAAPAYKPPTESPADALKRNQDQMKAKADAEAKAKKKATPPALPNSKVLMDQMSRTK